jgi:RNA polymerase sigma-70 factor (ECF subfamily)
LAPHEDDLPREVLERAARGDAAAFELIVRRFEKPVYSLVFRLTGDREGARDLAQDVFLKAWRNLARYDPERPFAPWFLKLAANLAINAREAARLRKTVPLEEHPAPRPEATDDEARVAVRKTIAELDPKYAACVALFYLDGLSVKEISERLGMPEGTVKIRLHRARDVLKERLGRFKEKP